MYSVGRNILFVLLSFLVCAVTVAQDTGESRRAVGGRSKGAMTGTRSGRVSSGGNYGAAAPAYRSSPSRGSVRYGRAGGSFSRSRDTVPSQTYTPDYHWSWSRWDDTNWFILRLMNEYRFVDGYNCLWRYRQGDSPLTRRTLSAALQECVAASSAILRLSQQLEGMVDQYERGELSQDLLERKVEETTRQIRKLSKKIRKDNFLDYIDQRQKDDVPSFEAAATVRGLKDLVGSLRSMADEVGSGLDAFDKNDMTRVVDVRELEQPSFDALSKGIDNLAKAIDKSAGRL